MNRKIKVFVISDHPLAPSGVGTQTNIVVRSLLDSGKFSIIAFAGAVKHTNTQPQKTEEYGDDLIIFPVEGYGTQEQVRSVLREHKPDILWFMTDPRFYYWLWDIENEIRGNVPMVYFHVWDNKPYPKFNYPLYKSNDKIVTISKVTSDIVKKVCPEVDEEYLPHVVDPELYKPFSGAERHIIRRENFKFMDNDNQLLFFWNSRNARRKLSGTLIFWFKEWLDKVGYDKAKLLLHTEPKDPNGQDLYRIIEDLKLTGERNNVILSTEKVPPEIMVKLYNGADATIGISDAEGFGLSTFESLSCGRPIIVNKTGGLQEQVQNGDKKCGIGIEPASKAIIGSQQVPYVYEDRISQQGFEEAMNEFLSASRETRAEWGKNGREHVLQNYNYEKTKKRWVEIMLEVYEKCGSWETRKNYKPWEIKEITFD